MRRLPRQILVGFGILLFAWIAYLLCTPTIKIDRNFFLSGVGLTNLERVERCDKIARSFALRWATRHKNQTCAVLGPLGPTAGSGKTLKMMAIVKWDQLEEAEIVLRESMKENDVSCVEIDAFLDDGRGDTIMKTIAIDLDRQKKPVGLDLWRLDKDEKLVRSFRIQWSARHPTMALPVFGAYEQTGGPGAIMQMLLVAEKNQFAEIRGILMDAMNEYDISTIEIDAVLKEGRGRHVSKSIVISTDTR